MNHPLPNATGTMAKWPPKSLPIDCLLVSLGHSMARVHTRPSGVPGEVWQGAQLWIVEPSCTEESTGYAPAESVTIYGTDKLIALRDMLDKAIAIAKKDAVTEPVAQAINEVKLHEQIPQTLP